MFDVEYGLFDKLCIQKTDNLITLGNTSAENKRLECTIAYNNIESRFPDLKKLYINKRTSFFYF